MACPLVLTVAEGELFAPTLFTTADCDLFDSRCVRFISSCADCERIDEVGLAALLEEHDEQEGMVMIDSLWP